MRWPADVNGLFLPVIIFLLIAHYSRAIRWKLLMEPIGYKPSTFNAFAAVMIGYLVNAGSSASW